MRAEGRVIFVRSVIVNEDHEYVADVELDGGRMVTIRVPSVTTVIDDMGLRPSYEGVPLGVLKRAGERGQIVHECVALDLFDNLEDDSVDDQLTGYIESWRLWKSQHKIEPILVETPIVYPAKQFGGTPDLFANVDDRWHIIDFKTRAPIEGDGEQLVGYLNLICHHLHKWQMLRKCVLSVLHLDKSGRPAELRRYEYGKHCDQWAYALSLWWTRRERGLL